MTRCQPSAGEHGKASDRDQPGVAGRQLSCRRRRFRGPLGGGLLFDTKRAGRHFVPDRGFASIGYGLPGAMGVAMAAPGKMVFSLTGDGGFNMMLDEIETARRLRLTFTVIVVNNAASGYVKALQHLVYGAGSYHASDLAETDYAAAAKVLGCNGIRVDEPGQLAAALKQAM
jgi:acetolactate synthase-1/2/3 large subunit